MRRRQLVEFRKLEKIRRHNAGQDEIAVQIEVMIELLTRQIADLDCAISKLVKEDHTLSLQARILRVVPGIG